MARAADTRGRGECGASFDGELSDPTGRWQSVSEPPEAGEPPFRLYLIGTNYARRT